MKNIYAEREGTTRTDVEIEKCNFAFYCAGGIVSVGDCE